MRLRRRSYIGYMDISNDLKLVKIKGKRGLLDTCLQKLEVDMYLAATIDSRYMLFKSAESKTSFLCCYRKKSFPLLVFYTSSPPLSALTLTFSLGT
jgi:hypothetical protein